MEKIQLGICCEKIGSYTGKNQILYIHMLRKTKYEKEEKE